ncbi:MAG: class I SAM-dependent methyltransferase [Rhodothermales bacterium]
MIQEYARAEYALRYLARADGIPHRTEGESVLLSFMPPQAMRILDLGAGDGRLLHLVLMDRPNAEGIALDASPTMLDAARSRFARHAGVQVLHHDLDEPLPDLGRFDAIVSGFAIHHCTDERKAAIYGEIFDRLEPGGVFCNLEHVASATPELHAIFLNNLGIGPDDEDPSNKLAPLGTQLEMLEAVGFAHVDCFWKWMELALFGGWKPLEE